MGLSEGSGGATFALAKHYCAFIKRLPADRGQ